MLVVLGVLGVLNVLNVLNVLYVLNMLHVLNVLHVLHGRIVGLLGLVLFFFSLYPFFDLSCSDSFCWPSNPASFLLLPVFFRPLVLFSLLFRRD